MYLSPTYVPPKTRDMMSLVFLKSVSIAFNLCRFFSHILERGTKKGNVRDTRSKDLGHLAPNKHTSSPVDEKMRVEEFERRLRFAMEQSLYLQAQHLSALDKFEKDLTQAKEESLLSQAIRQSLLAAPAYEKSRKPLKGILKKSRR